MAKTPANPRVERTRNCGTMTEAQFRGWIRSQLRRMSQRWRPIHMCETRVKSQATPEDKARLCNYRIKFVYTCEKCGARVDKRRGQVDHVTPVGQLQNIERDAGKFIMRMLVEDDGALQWLCTPCHEKKTRRERKR